MRNNQFSQPTQIETSTQALHSKLNSHLRRGVVKRTRKVREQAIEASEGALCCTPHIWQLADGGVRKIGVDRYLN